MTKKTNSIEYGQIAAKAIKAVFNERTRDILGFRFGLKDGRRQTLEMIGKYYGITRERVRQIEELALADIRKSVMFDLCKPAFNTIDSFINSQGQIVREDRLLSALTNTNEFNPERGALFFMLTLGKPYQRFVESDRFYPLWSNSEDGLKNADKIIEQLISNLNEIQKPVVLADFSSYLNQNKVSLSEKVLLSYLDATKRISQNSFGQFGLVKWPEISPRGVKDRAYMIFKDVQKPLHFKQVAELINKKGLGPNQAMPQTVHNELIKDGRFILVGRGTYALKEWGYQSGTVKDVITQVLKENGPLPKEQVAKKVLEARLVKPNTVFINLQNKACFVRDKQGNYRLGNN